MDQRSGDDRFNGGIEVIAISFWEEFSSLVASRKHLRKEKYKCILQHSDSEFF